jgi:hypothetical protein
MSQVCNCCICANEINSEELQSVALSNINTTRFKICQSCLDKCDPAEDYREAKDIVSQYLWFADSRKQLKKISDNK